MQAEIHPRYEAVNVQCSCGNAFKVRSTYGKEDLHIEMCAKCHPFYTGKHKVSTTGRAEKMRQRFGDFLSTKDA